MSNPEPRASDPVRRRWQDGFIVLFLALQIGVPLRYYLSGRDYDERFSWRMFSTLRLRDCAVHVTELPRGARATPHEVAIERDVHVAWLRLLERERSAVVDKDLQRRCELSEIERATYTRTCKDTDGSELPGTKRSLDCERGEFADEVAP
ncbi:MAG TPA: hypothetical protein VGI70_10625 [Polyangiales bacterium]|jgi:hypothetical protein